MEEVRRNKKLACAVSVVGAMSSYRRRVLTWKCLLWLLEPYLCSEGRVIVASDNER